MSALTDKIAKAIHRGIPGEIPAIVERVAILETALSQIERLTHESGPDAIYGIAVNAMFGLPAPAVPS